MNYYNEFDPKAAAWLRELINQNLIPNGHVDERSIVDVQGSDLAGYTQCHFFAGIGGWPLALRLAGWPEDRQVWTGSCPCQPFSTAGKQAGFADKRHLWPEFKRLIAECSPAVCFGEQVASPLGQIWLAGIRAELEGLGYAVGASDLCAAGASPEVGGWLIVGVEAWDTAIPVSFGPPDIRQRLYWVADADCERFDGIGLSEWEERQEMPEADGGCSAVWAGDAVSAGLEGHPGHGHDCEKYGWLHQDEDRPVAPSSGPWDTYDIMHFTDGKKRRIEPGLAPLAHGIPARMVRLRGYGNAIVPPLAQEFIQAYMSI